MKYILDIYGKQIPVSLKYGKEGFEKPPKILAKYRYLKYKIANMLSPEYTIKSKGNTEQIILTKWKEKHIPGYGNEPIAKLSKIGYSLSDIIRKLDISPYEINIAKAIPFIPLNVFLIEGIDEIWDLTTGVSGAITYDNTNSRIGVGNGTTATSDTQTGLQGASTAFAAMDAGYPISTTSKQAVFKSTFPSGTAEFAWEEYTVDNGNTRNKNIFRALQSNGTKPAGQTWVLQCTLTIS